MFADGVGVFERRGVIVPGLPALPAGVERYAICGGGTCAVPVKRGDEVTLVDREGLQAAEVVLFSSEGGRGGGKVLLEAEDDGCVRLAAGGGEGIYRALQKTAGGAKTLAALRAGGFAGGGDLAAGDWARAKVLRLFGDGSRAGEARRLMALADGLLIAHAAGEAMRADAQNALTEIVLFVRRSGAGVAGAAGVAGLAGLGKVADGRMPPPPLAPPLQDFNIRPGQAVAYEVRAGCFIQILDVQGRECSDFQAMSLRALDGGLERDIDPTTTRSLTGRLYPAPGLFAKYFSVDHEPLVEIVQDTCGRHDTFGLACTARYYEDLGYPGHVNCSDNINRDLARWQVRPRGGWPAINFFFNTMLDDASGLFLDEPWSRPGDYVLLRALTDLVCVSTACPCDIDAANGWLPTDIQVRVYAAGEDFQRAAARRRTAEDDMQETQKTGFHDCFAHFTRDFGEYNGFWLANTMTNGGATAEYWACRERVAVMDLSPLRKFEVTGPDAEALLQLCVTRDVKRLGDGQVVYTAMCHAHGGMIDDGTVFRLGETNYRWVGGCDASGLQLRETAAARGLNAWVRESTSQLCNIAVQGRHSRALLEEILWTPPARAGVGELGWFRFTVARLGGFGGAACVLSRTGYTGELGFELFCHPTDAAAFFDAVCGAGEKFGIAPLGLAALDMLRIEAGLVFAGSEFCEETDPFEAGIGFTVALDGTREDFIGRAALEERRAHPQRRLVGLEVEGGVVPKSGDCVRVCYPGRAQVGSVTSAVKSPLLGRVIALARVAVTHAEAGAALEVGQLDGQQKRLRARVVDFPHFDPGKERVRGRY